MKSSRKQNFQKPVASPCGARAKIHKMASSAAGTSRGPGTCLDPERHTSWVASLLLGLE